MSPILHCTKTNSSSACITYITQIDAEYPSTVAANDRLYIASSDGALKASTITDGRIDSNTQDLELHIQIIINSDILCGTGNATFFDEIVQDDFVRVFSERVIERKGKIEGRFCVALEIKVVQRAATKGVRIVARITSCSSDLFEVGIEPIWVGNTDTQIEADSQTIRSQRYRI